MGIFTLYAIGCLGGHEKPWVLCEQQGPKAAQVFHTHRTSCRGGWPRGFGELNSSPHSWIFAPVSVGSSRHSYLFTSVTGRIGVHCTKVWHKTYPICDAALSRSAGPAQLRPVTEIALPRNRSCVWTEDLSGMILAVAQNLSGIVQWRIQGRGPRGLPPPLPVIFIWYHFGGGAKSVRYSVILNTAEIIDQPLT